MTGAEASFEGLLRRAGTGDRSAAGLLLDHHRDRLRRMISVRIDPRVAARVDPSDIVQEAFGEALRKLPDYLSKRPVAFYPWLRQIAWERLVHLHRRHIYVQKRSVDREMHGELPLPDESAMRLVDQLADDRASPSKHALQQEMRERVRAALDQMVSHDREVLVMWHLEGLSVDEIAEVLAMTPAGVKSRHRRALERFVRVLDDDSSGT